MQTTVIDASASPEPKTPGRPSTGSKYDGIVEQLVNLYDSGTGQRLRIELDQDEKSSVIHAIGTIVRARLAKTRENGVDLYRLRQVTVETGKVFDVWVTRLDKPAEVKPRPRKQAAVTEPAVETAVA